MTTTKYTARALSWTFGTTPRPIRACRRARRSCQNSLMVCDHLVSFRSFNTLPGRCLWSTQVITHGGIEPQLLDQTPFFLKLYPHGHHADSQASGNLQN